MLRTPSEHLGIKRFFLFGASGGFERWRNPCAACQMDVSLSSPPLFTFQAGFSTNTQLYLHLPFVLSPQAKLFLLQEARSLLKMGALHGLGLVEIRGALVNSAQPAGRAPHRGELPWS